ncbi:carbohydrate-binding protein [Fulvivirga sp. M361]|uniref:carbohydrate-binding protein n=1 Tax=Fulvivirga sp. M361 TaxID=2594266 RepID=UPI00117B2762|nr:carbohydrate-binding protein [Fulvivirga sp. M361]TRX60640.1 carbohydrate-binding protein [Fulvivirga sp. M361]
MKAQKLLLLSACALLTTSLVFAQPTFQSGQDPKPAGKKWEKIQNMSDEFNGSSLDGSKWAKSDPQWAGRVPGKFKENTIVVGGGDLKVTNYKLSSPEGSYTHACGLIRSLAKNTYGYYETRMKASRTFMSSTFWLFNKRNEGSGCDVRTTELDITETVGFNSNGASWVDTNIRSMNSNTHSRGTTCSSTPVGQQGNKAALGGQSWQDYHVYGVWWKSKTELLFYLDGQFKYQITPPADFNLPMYLRMVTETYDWNPVPPDGGMTGSADSRTTYYDWTRSWRLVDDNNPNPGNTTVNCTSLPSSLTSGTSITASVDYTTDQSRDVVIELWNSGWLGQGKTTVNAGSGTANVTINLSNAPAAGSNYLLKASIRPVGAPWQQNIDACNKSNITVTTGGSANQAPYGGTARTLPGSVEAEHFDTGGQGVAYNDTGANNIGGSFRTSEGVDITSLAAGGHTVGWTANGEWLEYTVNFNVSQDYDFFPSVSSPSSSGRLRILIDGVAQTGDLTVPNTGSYNTYQVMHVRNINVSAGTHVVRMEIVNSGFNLNSWAAWKAQFPAARTIGDLEEQISGPADMKNINVYPNPFSSGNLTIVPRSNQPGVIQIFSLQGKQIFERNIQGNSIEITRDVFNASGIYIIKVNDLRQKLIVH